MAERPHGPDFEVVTFDCYGTLVDWERGIGDAFEARGRAAGVALPRDAVVAAYAKFEPIVEAGPYRSYREVLRETARRVAERFDLALEPACAGFLAESLPAWPPFPDTRPALERLAAAGYRLGILSNVDVDLLAGTLRGLGLEFEPIVTAQEVRAYKPAHAHFREARRRIGEARWLHAAQSWFHDVVPASELRVPVAWIRRAGTRPRRAPPPDHEFANLTELADWLV